MQRFLKNDWQSGQVLKAHQGEINDIAIVTLDETTLIASCGRDRTVQLFQKQSSELVLFQTIDQHGSSVNELRFLESGRVLLSSSSDRTIMINTLARGEHSMAFVPTRIITLKQSPMSMALSPDDSGILVVTTMDKQLHRYELNSGQPIGSHRLMDDNSLVMLASTTTQTIDNLGTSLRILLGVSSTDKSVRIHDFDTGSTLAKGYGHSEGISSTTLIQENSDPMKFTVVSTGLDGTVMLWDLTYVSRLLSDQSTPTTPLQETASFVAPLRRIISRSTLAEFSKTLDASGMSHITSPAPRSASPTRLRKKPSRYSLAASPTPTIRPLTTSTSFRARDRSPSPPSPAVSVLPLESKRPRPIIHRTHSVGSFTDLNFPAEQLCRSLRAYRKKLAVSSDSLRIETMKELERELGLTAKALGQKTRRHQSASEANVGDLLDQYSDKLARMVEEKVRLGSLGEAGKGNVEKPDEGVVEKGKETAQDTEAEPAGKG